MKRSDGNGRADDLDAAVAAATAAVEAAKQRTRLRRTSWQS
ncbi:hypothetical protein [Escherichia coli]|nr:hypothetical protein [Escherichia coli]